MSERSPECRVLLLTESKGKGSELFEALATRKAGSKFSLRRCGDVSSAFEALESGGYDILLLDLGQADSLNVSALVEMRDRCHCPIVVLSDSNDEQVAALAMQNGAQDFLGKDILNSDLLERTMHHSIERHRMLAELEAAKRKAEAASKAKSDFLAVMSHEFRTPMNGILGGINLLRNFNSDPQAIELLNMMRQCAESQLDLISDVLDISRIEAGSVQLTFERFSPRDLIASVLSAVAFDAREKGVRLAVDIDPKLPRELVSDARRVRQVMMNLVGNAMKFTEQGEVRICARKLNDRLIEFRVIDTGIGIASQALDSIFETFTQVDSSYSRRYQGTGLGLAICKRLVKLLGGAIRVESKVGVGSDFRFTIACGEREELLGSEAWPQDPTDPGFAERFPLSILVVEDNELVRTFLMATFEKLGYVARQAESGAQALSLSDEQAFDAIFMDVRMPDLDGFETAEMIRDKQLDSGKPRPYVAAITASVTGDVERRCEEAGFSALLAKPIEIEDLRALLRAAYQQTQG
ncbi:response regulator [Pelagicoccus sp. SDUM812003]|nr:response regulator [Pelagicoccus sp. SDUM812003]